MSSENLSSWKSPKGAPLWEVIFACGRPKTLEYCLEQMGPASEKLYQDQLKNYVQQYNDLMFYDSCMLPHGICSLEVVKAMLEHILKGLVGFYDETTKVLEALVNDSLETELRDSISRTQTQTFLRDLIRKLCEEKRHNSCTKSSRNIPTADRA